MVLIYEKYDGASKLHPKISFTNDIRIKNVGFAKDKSKFPATIPM
jgi:hypothetical protein